MSLKHIHACYICTVTLLTNVISRDGLINAPVKGNWIDAADLGGICSCVTALYVNQKTGTSPPECLCQQGCGLTAKS